MNSIKVTALEAIQLEGGDAGNRYDALGEAIVLSIQEDKIVRLRTSHHTYIIDPLEIRAGIAELTNPEIDDD